MLNILLIEADNQKNLGGSCSRDLVNMVNYLGRIGETIRQQILLSISPIPSLQTKPLSNYKSEFVAFSQQVKKGDSVVVMISGHGYQKRSNDGKEKDGMDEYISYGSGIIEDGQLRAFIEQMLPHEPERIICLIDTCHSGTMFDLDQITCPHPHTKLISLSACQDHQLDSCDLSSIGFGGSLTVHLLEIKDALSILLHQTNQSIQNQIIHPLTVILRPLGQKPDFYSL